MNANEYRKFLKERNISTETIDSAIAVIENFEATLQISNQAKTADTASEEDTKAFSEQLICEERNTFETYLALLKYGVFIGNRALYVTVLKFLDGAEAFGNLHIKLADAFGEAKRDTFFEGVTLPPLGTQNEKKPALIQQVLDRLETDDPEACKRILGSGLRNLHDE